MTVNYYTWFSIDTSDFSCKQSLALKVFYYKLIENPLDFSIKIKLYFLFQ